MPGTPRCADRLMPDQSHPTTRGPHCQSRRITRLKTSTELAYRRFHCRASRRTDNERTGTPFHYLEYPTDLVMPIVLWRLRYPQNLRDVVELCLLRGVTLTHETVRDWEQRCAPYLTGQLKLRRRGQCSTRWHVDETYVNGKGQWVDVYRAIDRDGDLVDTLLSVTRSNKAAIRFYSNRRAALLYDDGQARVIPQGDSPHLPPQSHASHQSVSEQPHRAGSPGHQAPVWANLGIYVLRLCYHLLRCRRRNPLVIPHTADPEGDHFPGPRPHTLLTNCRRIRATLPVLPGR